MRSSAVPKSRILPPLHPPPTSFEKDPRDGFRLQAPVIPKREASEGCLSIDCGRLRTAGNALRLTPVIFSMVRRASDCAA